MKAAKNRTGSHSRLRNTIRTPLDAVRIVGPSWIGMEISQTTNRIVPFTPDPIKSNLPPGVVEGDLAIIDVSGPLTDGNIIVGPTSRKRVTGQPIWTYAGD